MEVWLLGTYGCLIKPYWGNRVGVLAPSGIHFGGKLLRQSMGAMWLARMGSVYGKKSARTGTHLGGSFRLILEMAPELEIGRASCRERV